MKKIIFGLLAVILGLGLTACSDDDDYTVATGDLLHDGSVVTGSSDVTATTATIYGTVEGLDNCNPASYTTGFYYGYAADALTEQVSAASAGTFQATLTSQQSNTTIYYQAFVTLQGRLTYKGEVKSLITTDATATTGDVTDVQWYKATFAGAVSKYTEDAKAGIVISMNPDQEAVRAGLQIQADQLTDNFSVTQLGLLPGKTYYYCTYLDLGSGKIYGDVKQFTTPNHEYNVDDDFVDLGLSVKWAKANIGAPNASDLGGLFGFGDVTGCNSSLKDGYASADIYKTAQDIANIAYNGKATLPTIDDFDELFKLCKHEWKTVDGVSGMEFTGPNGNTLFLPAAGSRVESTVSGQGTEGHYLSGSINAGDNKYAMSYMFNQSVGARTTTPVYQALSIRAVTTARNNKLHKADLYNTWEIDIKDDGKSVVWAGPVYFMGTDNSWRTQTNGEPIVGNVWNWDADASNTWAFDGVQGCKGSMTIFNNGGKDSITVTKIYADGTSKTEKGAVTIDTVNYVITSDVDLLVPTNFTEPMVNNRKTQIKVLVADGEKLQLGFYRDSDPATLAVNYIPQLAKYGIDVNWLGVGSDWNGTWGTTVASLMPSELEGQHTFTYNGAENGAMVNTLDFKGLKQMYPNAFVRIDDIKLDGKSIPFNANNFCYGDIEGNGNYRVELFNIWGKGAQNGNIIASPFSDLKGVASDPAFTFANSLEVTYTILLNGPEGQAFTPNLITINPSWGGTWGYNEGASFTVNLNPETAKYEASVTNFDITYAPADVDHSAGSIMTFIEIADLFKFFPGTSATLNTLKLDGSSVTFDASKVPGSNEGDKYRLELWNMYGLTSQIGCAFGTNAGDGVIKELGFKKSMEVNFTINNLFAVPNFK